MTTARDTKLVPTPAKNIRASESMTLLPNDGTHKGWESCIPVYRSTRFLDKRLLLCRRNVVQRSPIPKTIHLACPRAATIMLADRWAAAQGPAHLDSDPFSTGLGSIAVLDVPVGDSGES